MELDGEQTLYRSQNFEPSFSRNVQYPPQEYSQQKFLDLPQNMIPNGKFQQQQQLSGLEWQQQASFPSKFQNQAEIPTSRDHFPLQNGKFPKNDDFYQQSFQPHLQSNFPQYTQYPPSLPPQYPPQFSSQPQLQPFQKQLPPQFQQPLYQSLPQPQPQQFQFPSQISNYQPSSQIESNIQPYQPHDQTSQFLQSRPYEPSQQSLLNSNPLKSLDQHQVKSNQQQIQSSSQNQQTTQKQQKPQKQKQKHQKQQKQSPRSQKSQSQPQLQSQLSLNQNDHKNISQIPQKPLISQPPQIPQKQNQVQLQNQTQSPVSTQKFQLKKTSSQDEGFSRHSVYLDDFESETGVIRSQQPQQMIWKNSNGTSLVIPKKPSFPLKTKVSSMKINLDESSDEASSSSDEENEKIKEKKPKKISTTLRLLPKEKQKEYEELKKLIEAKEQLLKLKTMSQLNSNSSTPSNVILPSDSTPIEEDQKIVPKIEEISNSLEISEEEMKLEKRRKMNELIERKKKNLLEQMKLEQEEKEKKESEQQEQDQQEQEQKEEQKEEQQVKVFNENILQSNEDQKHVLQEIQTESLTNNVNSIEPEKKEDLQSPKLDVNQNQMEEEEKEKVSGQNNLESSQKLALIQSPEKPSSIPEQNPKLAEETFPKKYKTIHKQFINSHPTPNNSLQALISNGQQIKKKGEIQIATQQKLLDDQNRELNVQQGELKKVVKLLSDKDKEINSVKALFIDFMILFLFLFYFILFVLITN